MLEDANVLGHNKHLPFYPVIQAILSKPGIGFPGHVRNRDDEYGNEDICKVHVRNSCKIIDTTFTNLGFNA